MDRELKGPNFGLGYGGALFGSLYTHYNCFSVMANSASHSHHPSVQVGGGIGLGWGETSVGAQASCFFVG